MGNMLVDEYGSNSTLQLPGFCMSAMLKDEEGGRTRMEGILSLSPLNMSPESLKKMSFLPLLKGIRLYWKMLMVSLKWKMWLRLGKLETAHTDQADNTKATNCQLGQQHWLSLELHISMCPCHLHHCIFLATTSSPPPSPPLQQAQCAMSDSYNLNGFEDGGYPNMRGDHQAGPPRMNPPLSGNTMHYQGPESSYSSGVQLTNSIPLADSSNFQHRPYPSHPHPPPPPPPPQHQYSFTEPGHHMKSRRDTPSYSHRSQYVPNFDERIVHDNHERMRHAP